MSERDWPPRDSSKGPPTQEEVTRPAIQRGGAAAQATDNATTARMRRDKPLASHWAAQGIDPDSARIDRGGTIVPPASTKRSMQPPSPTHKGAILPALRVTDDDDLTAEFRLGRVLGAGGMGVVQTATQRTLGREVAIKTLRADADLASEGPQLLLEARVTGTLDHPNVVPVHAIGRDQSDRPLIVMKRIEGTSWDALIEELSVRGKGTFDEALSRHLTILVQVARALHFAHSKGILHRDLKPSNVMIGEFGEVYLVDWGIAVGLDERAPAGLPRASDCDGLAGTAAYMAPEMAACMAEMLSVRTDVYLLGSVLHELITGFAPHEAPTMRDALRRAFESAPYEYGAEIPGALAAICHRAMAWDPERRFETAGDFATAVEEFLHHRGSTALSDQALGLLAELEERTAHVGEESVQRVRALRATFSEARFAFRHALKIWPGNGAARSGLQRALELLVEFELRSSAPDAAALLLDELPEPRPELAARVQQAVDAQRSMGARLHLLERDADVTIGDRQRAFMMVAASLLWSACCIGTGLLRRHTNVSIGAAEFSLVCVGFGAILALIAGVGHRSLYANAATKRIAQTTLLIFVAYSVLWGLGAHFKVDVAAISATTLVAGCVLWTSLAVQGQRRWAGMAAGMALGLLALLRWPEYNFEWMGVASLVGGVLGTFLRLRTQWIESHRRAGASDAQ